MTRAWQFWLLSFLVATVQGGSQALVAVAVRDA